MRYLCLLVACFFYINNSWALHSSAYKHRVLVLTAMPSEAAAIAKYLMHKKNIYRHGVSYTQGIYGNHRVIITTTGIGKVNAAAITSASIISFHPKQVIFSGIAGKINPSLKLGDIVVGSRLYAVEHQVIGHKLLPDYVNQHTGSPNPAWVYASPRLIQDARKVKKNTWHATRVLFGSIATTDVFPPEIYSSQEAMQSGSVAIDMEGFAFLATCQVLHTDCLVVRAISDNSLRSLTKHYKRAHYTISLDGKQIAEQKVALFTMQLLKQL